MEARDQPRHATAIKQGFRTADALNMGSQNCGKNTLDGLTILRFAHAFSSGGGVESYIEDLDAELALRYDLTLIDVRLTESPIPQTNTPCTDSRPRRVKVLLPLTGSANEKTSADSPQGAVRRRASEVLDWALFTPRLNSVCAKSLLRWRRPPLREIEAFNAGATVASLLDTYHVDLVVLHTSGGRDASEVIAAAKRSGIPIALVHHFSNQRLGSPSVRQQVANVDAVGVASAVGIPRYLRRSCYNLSDAVDTAFYDPRRAAPILQRPVGPVLYVPGRITPGKGQRDAIRVATLLRQQGLRTSLVFAGRTDSVTFERQLRAAAIADRIESSCLFLGELTLDRHRDWFAAADLVLLPTHHEEGMPRTLIDAQAMKSPPIVYDIGGTREGVCDRETGFLVPLGDTETMANSAARLLSDERLHHRMAEAGRSFVVRRFTVSALAARHAEFYLRALSHRPH